jgi:hypothetical protein
VSCGPLNCYYVHAPSMELGVSRPRIAEMVGRIVGELRVAGSGDSERGIEVYSDL